MASANVKVKVYRIGSRSFVIRFNHDIYFDTNEQNFRTLTVLIASILFMPIVEILLSTASCNGGYLRFTPSITCGAWPQLVFVIIALLVFVTMLPLNFFLIALNYESLPPKEVGISVAQVRQLSLGLALPLT
jgi:hypothetical protein